MINSAFQLETWFLSELACAPYYPVTCDDLGLTGALTALMKDALKPTLMQTLVRAAVRRELDPGLMTENHVVLGTSRNVQVHYHS